MELLIISIIGVAGLIMLAHLLGGSRGGSIATESDAKAIFAKHVTDFEVGDAVLSETGRSALISEKNGGRLGVVLVVGDEFAVRTLAAGDVSDVDLNRSRRKDQFDLTLHLKDVTCPKVALRMRDDIDDNYWWDRAVALKS